MARRKKNRRAWGTTGVALLICAGVCLVVVGLRSASALMTPEFAAYDAFVSRPSQRLRVGTSSRPPAAGDSMAAKVVVIQLTEQDINDDRVQFPIHDSALVHILQKVLDCQPRAVGIDIIRDRPVPMRQESVPPATRPASDPSPPTPRAKLEAIWNSDPRVVQGVLLDDAGRLPGLPPNLPAERVGLADWPRDNDDVVRRGILYAGNPDQGTFPSLPCLLSQIYLAQEDPPVTLAPVPPDDPKSRDLQLGRTVFRHLGPSDGAYVKADTRGIQYLLDYGAPPPESFRHWTVLDVLDGRFRPDDFAGKVVLVGVTMPTAKDELRTPAPNRVGSSQATSRYGVDMQAMATEQLLRAALRGPAATRFWPDYGEAAWVLPWGLAGGAAGLWLRGWRLGVVAAAGAAVLVAACYAAFAAGWWIPLVPPLLAWLGAGFFVTAYVSLRENADRQLMRQMFAASVSDDVADAYWRERDAFVEHGRITPRPVTATVLFTDLKGFSTLSEKMPATELMAWLNEYMEAMSDVVTGHGGMVNKYIGDAVMAVFGVPVPREGDEEIRADANNAVRCALGMREALARLNGRWAARGLPMVAMRVGIYTGRLVAGSLGTKRQEYAVIGDTVNTASRLESYDKDLMAPDIAAAGCRILIGQPTRDLLDAAVRTRYIGDLALKGKDRKVGVYGVVGGAPPAIGPVQGSAAAAPGAL